MGQAGDIAIRQPPDVAADDYGNSDELHAVLLRQRAMDGWMEARVIRVRRRRCRLLQAEPLLEVTLHASRREQLKIGGWTCARVAEAVDYAPRAKDEGAGRRLDGLSTDAEGQRPAEHIPGFLLPMVNMLGHPAAGWHGGTRA